MKFTFLGSGSAFTVGADNYHSNMLLESESGKKLLIDCGSDIRFSLHELGLSYKDITDVYISHLHADHSGGLEFLAYQRKFHADGGKPTLYINDKLAKAVWQKLAPGLSSLQGEIAALDTYFHTFLIPANDSFTWENVNFRLVQSVHVMNGYMLVPSFGLLFEINQRKIYITSDTQFCPHQIKDFYQMADVVFHDCETASPASGVHATYDDLLTLNKTIKAKIWLYHYNPGTLPQAEKDGFQGFVKKGQCFIF